MPGSTPASATADRAAPASPPRPRRRAGGGRRRWRDPAALTGAALTALVLGVAGAAGRLAPGNPFATSPSERLLAPSGDHLMGTDQLGRDLFTNVVQGARTSLSIVVGVVAVSSAIGLALGAVSGFRGGIVDAVVRRLVDTVQSIPRFFVAVLVAGLFGTGRSTLVLLLGLTSWPLLARVVRAETLSVRERDYVAAARSMGAPARRIILRHVIPNVAPSAIVVVALTGSRVVLLEAGLAYLGLSDPNVASWGALVNNAQPYLQTAWWLSVFPGLAIAVTVLGLNLLADGLSDALHPGALEAGAGRPD